jgi:ketosteroid isomerase-like protein
MNVLDELLAWYETLAPDTLDALPRLYAEQAHFKDPFNDVHGHAAIRRIFAHMFETTDAPRFVIHERIVQGDQAFVTWTFHFGLRGQAYTVVGGSHLRFGADGRVTDHRDYWDAAEELFQKLPVIGPVVKWLRGRFAVT